MNDETIEKEIKENGLTAPRVTPTDIEANIASEHYFTAREGAIGEAWKRSDDDDEIDGVSIAEIHDYRSPLGLLTFCVIVMKNGFTVTGESACASPDNFDAELGRKIARQNAVQKIWPLMGYALKQDLFERRDVSTTWSAA